MKSIDSTLAVDPESGDAADNKFANNTDSQSGIEQHIVCVDDDHIFLKSLESFLPGEINKNRPPEQWYRFHFLDTPEVALNTLRELKDAGEGVAMIITDQKMPRMTGTQFLAGARKVEESSVRVLLTGYGGLDSAMEAINERLLDKYLTKPIENEHDFVVTINLLLQQYHMQKAIAEKELVIRRLFFFSNELNAAKNMQDTLSHIISFVKGAIECDYVAVFLTKNATLRMAAADGFFQGVSQTSEFKIAKSVSEDMIRDNKAVVANSVETIPFFDDLNVGNTAVLVRPPVLYIGLVADEDLLGMINITHKSDALPFNEHDLEVLTYIGNTASIAIQNQANRERLQEAYLEVEARLRSVIGEEAPKVSDS